MAKFIVKYHPRFLKDMRNLSRAQLEAVHRKIERIKTNPENFKELGGKNNCYTVRIENMRLVYYFDRLNLWFLILDDRGNVYEEYLKRLYALKSQLNL